MPRYRDEFDINLPLSEAVATCRKAIETLGWRVTEQGEMHLLCQETAYAAWTNRARVEILFAAKSAEATRVMLNGASSGWGPFVSSYLKKRVALLRKVIELAAGPAAPPLEKPSPDKSRKEVLVTPLSEKPGTDKSSQDSPRKRHNMVKTLVVTSVLLLGYFVFALVDKEYTETAFWLFISVGLILLAIGSVGLIVIIIRKQREMRREMTVGERVTLLKTRWGIALGDGVALLIMGVVLAAVMPSETTPTSTSESEPTPVETVETLDKILGRAAGITTVKYDLVISLPEMPPSLVNVWIKGNKMRLEVNVEGESLVVIQNRDAQTLYNYIPSQNVALKAELEAGDEGQESTSPLAMAKRILKSSPVSFGSEPRDGKETVLVEGTATSGERFRTWLWKEYGIPIRLETWTTEGKLTMELQNMEFFYIPDSMFELPPDVQIETVPLSEMPVGSTAAPDTEASSAPMPTTVPRLYTNPEFRYSIEVLEGWTVDDTEKDNLKIRSPDRRALVQIFANIYDWKITLEATLSNKSSFRAKEQDYQELSRTKSVLPGGLPAYSVIAKWTSKGNTYLSRTTSVMTVKTNREIELIAGISDTVWEKYWPQLEQIAYSLALAD